MSSKVGSHHPPHSNYFKSYPYMKPELSWKSLTLLMAIIFVVTRFWVLPGDESVTFLSLGDFGTGSADQRLVSVQMSKAVEAYGPAFILSLGDNFYPSGVKNDSDPLFQKYFEDIYNQEQLQRPWYMALGDHDHRGSVSSQVNYSSKSKRWTMLRPYYLIQKSLSGKRHVDIVVTDSVRLEGYVGKPDPKERRFFADYTLKEVDYKAGKEHYDWLENTLMRSDADWLIVVGHRPVISCADRPRFPAEKKFSKMMSELLSKYKVDAYVHGHDHIGQHLEENGVIHIGNGVGGYGNHPAVPNKFTIWFNDHYNGFVVHKISVSKMAFSFVASNGTVVHTVEKWKQANPRKKL